MHCRKCHRIQKSHLRVKACHRKTRHCHERPVRSIRQTSSVRRQQRGWARIGDCDLAGMLEKEINIAIRKSVVVNLHIVDQAGKKSRRNSAEIQAANQECNRITNERLTRFDVLSRRAIDVNRLVSTGLIDSHDLMPVAIINARGRDGCLSDGDLCASCASLVKRCLIIHQQSAGFVYIQKVSVSGTGGLLSENNRGVGPISRIHFDPRHNREISRRKTQDIAHAHESIGCFTETDGIAGNAAGYKSRTSG